MRSKNPIFSNNEAYAQSGGYATFRDTRDSSAAELQAMYDGPTATSLQTGRMTMDDVVVKTGALFAVLLATAGFAWFANLGIAVAFIAAIAAFVLAMVVSFRRTINPGLTLAYAALEGVFVGALSHAYETAWNGVVPQAVLGTLLAFTGMLVAYRSGRLRATPKFTKMLMIAGFGYLGVALVSLVAAMFGVGGGWGFYGTGPLGILLCLAGVAIASLYLVLDFDFIERGVRNGLPERESWRAAFGLLVTLVWLYLEILRLLAVLREN